MNFQQGAMGPVNEVSSLLRFWTQMEKLHYPMAADMKKSLEEQLAAAQRPAQAAPAAAVPAETRGGAGVTGGAGDLLPTGGEVTA